MSPLLLIALGAVALLGGAAVLRTYGPGLRVGRLLAATRTVSIEEARGLAERGERRYVRVEGRIDSEEDFEDAAHRPLVFRRTRVEARVGRDWQVLEDGREIVSFQVGDAGAAVDVDGAALDEGLVVVPRLSAGVAGDLGDRAPTTLSPETPVRVRIDQISSVEHAIVLGVPVADDGRVRMTAGLGRPLVLTTLEQPEAMRVLGGGATGKARAAVALLGGGAALVIAGIAWWVVVALLAVVAPGAAFAASPDVTPAPGGGGDPRSVGEGPGLVGDPLFAILLVVGIGLLAAGLTWLYVRATGGPGTRTTPRR